MEVYESTRTTNEIKNANLMSTWSTIQNTSEDVHNSNPNHTIKIIDSFEM